MKRHAGNKIRRPKGFTTLEINIPSCPSRPVKKNCSNGAGFTLIELLVVIAIISLLMAILVPSLQRVRRQTKAVVCQSNLRQWGQAFSIYADDYDGKLFGYDSRNPLGSIYWVEAIRSYWSDCNDLLLCPMTTKSEIRKDNLIGHIGSKSTAWVWKWKTGIISGSYATNMAVAYSPR